MKVFTNSGLDVRVVSWLFVVVVVVVGVVMRMRFK